MIIKKQDLPSETLANFINYINGKHCIPEDGNSPVITLKSVNPGNERGLYSIDIEFHETYTSIEDKRRPTDSKFWTDLFGFFGSRS